MEQFDRQYRLAAGSAGNKAFEIGATTTASPTALHINFTIDKCDTETPNTANISIWNLNPAQLAVLNEKDCVVTLRAGYGSFMPLIFVGVVTFVSTVQDGADRETSLELVDGGIELRDTFVSLSYSGAINSKKIIESIASHMGITVSFSYNAEFHDFKNGFSVVGPGRVALDKACSSNNLQWQIQNGILQVKKRNDTMTKEVFVLSPDSGLLGVPKKVMFGKDALNPEERTGWEVVYLLNGAIGIGDYLRLESSTVKGYFMVHSIEMTGDNIEGGWQCVAQLFET